MKAIVLFNPASSGELLKSTAKELGFKVIAVFVHPMKSFEEIYHVQKETLFRDCDEIIISPDKEEILQKLKASPFTIAGTIGATEGGVELADQVANALNLWRNPIELSKARRDKGKMRKLLKESGLTCPDFAICYTEEEVRHFANTHLFPLMIKTPRGVMTSQVYQCDNLAALLEGFHHICNTPDIYGEQADHCVLEEYLSGKEYVVDTFSDGKSVHVTDIWVYEKISSDTFKNIYYNVISLPLSDPTLKPLIDYSIRVAKIFGIERGAAHIELKDDPIRGPTLIEMGARLAGARIPEMVKKYSNFDPYQASIEVFVSGKTKIPSPVVFKKHLAIAFFPQMKGGKVKNIRGIDAIQQLSSYDFHLLGILQGDTIPVSSHASTIPLIAFFANSDQAQLLKDLSAAHQLFKIDLSMEETA